MSLKYIVLLPSHSPKSSPPRPNPKHESKFLKSNWATNLYNQNGLYRLSKILFFRTLLKKLIAGVSRNLRNFTSRPRPRQSDMTWRPQAGGEDWLGRKSRRDD